jgi:hypothetical protein
MRCSYVTTICSINLRGFVRCHNSQLAWINIPASALALCLAMWVVQGAYASDPPVPHWNLLVRIRCLWIVIANSSFHLQIRAGQKATCSRCSPARISYDVICMLSTSISIHMYVCMSGVLRVNDYWRHGSNIAWRKTIGHTDCRYGRRRSWREELLCYQFIRCMYVILHKATKNVTSTCS